MANENSKTTRGRTSFLWSIRFVKLREERRCKRLLQSQEEQHKRDLLKRDNRLLGYLIIAVGSLALNEKKDVVVKFLVNLFGLIK